MRGCAVGVARLGVWKTKKQRKPDGDVLTQRGVLCICLTNPCAYLLLPTRAKAAGVMTALDDVPKMTVAKLRDALQAKGLDTTGLKAALVARLQEALQSGGADVPAPSPKPSPGRASKRKRDSTSEPPAPAPEPAPLAPALEPAPEPPLPAEPAPPPAKATPTVAPVAPSPASENREAAPVSAMDARAAAIAALTADLKDEPDEDPADDAAQTTVRPSKTTQTTTACPYLDTVNRSLLDFDFEKCCSVSLSPHNVYACLVCGKYFQGRGVTTPAYTHALEHGHHVFLRLADGKVRGFPNHHVPPSRLPIPVPEGTSYLCPDCSDRLR